MIYTFSEVLEIHNGKNQRNVENKNGNYPIYGSGGIIGFADKYLCDEPAVIIGRKGSINNPLFVDKPFWNVDTAFALVPNSSLLDVRYLYYFCLSYNFNVLSTTVTIPSLTKFNLLKVKIEVPSLEEQKQIVHKLDKIEMIIGLKERQLKNLEGFIRSRFIEMFGDSQSNPKGFPYKRINEFAKCIAGATPSTKRKEYWSNGIIPWMSSGEVNYKRIWETEKRISQIGYDSCSTKMIPAHTVVIAMAGQGRTRGTVAVAEIPLCTNQSLCSMITDGTVDTDYLFTYLQFQYNNLRNISNGSSGRGGLNIKLIGQFTVLVPPLAVQQKFSNFLKEIDKSKYRGTISLHLLEDVSHML